MHTNYKKEQKVEKGAEKVQGYRIKAEKAADEEEDDAEDDEDEKSRSESSDVGTSMGGGGREGEAGAEAARAFVRDEAAEEGMRG